MATATEIIDEEYKSSEPYAEECLRNRAEDLRTIKHPRERTSVLQDCLNAWRVLFERSVLLAAWKETPETAAPEALIAEARRRLALPHFIEVIVEAMAQKHQLEPEILQRLSACVRYGVEQRSRRIEHLLLHPELYKRKLQKKADRRAARPPLPDYSWCE